VMLKGSACAQLEGSTAAAVEVLFGCPGTPFPARLP
jgi:hypothetical protein